jgi:nitrous oxidase accessory protein NosD
MKHKNMKKRLMPNLILIILALSMFFIVKADITYGNTVIIVDDDGDADYSNIQDAIDAASNGDTIRVYEGIYFENIIIDKNLFLIGNGSHNTIIDGNKSFYVVKIIADNVRFIGFTVKRGENGIIISMSNNIEIENDFITKNTRYGINITSSKDVMISNNNISFNLKYYNHPLAVKISQCEEIGIFNNIMFKNAGAIWIDKTSDITICNNHMEKDGETYGSAPVLLKECRNAVVTENTVIRFILISFQCSRCNNIHVDNNNFSKGFAVYHSNRIDLVDNIVKSKCQIKNSSYVIVEDSIIDSKEGLEISSSSNVTIFNISIVEKKYGIQMSKTTDSNIKNNSIIANQYHGILMDKKSLRNMINGNIITHNGINGIDCWGRYNIFSRNLIGWNGDVGLNFPYTAMKNEIFDNNFIDNKMNAYTVFNFRWNGDVGGNYWSDYKGIDVDNDGFGDVPYRIPRGFFHWDRHPSIEPYDIPIPQVP